MTQFMRYLSKKKILFLLFFLLSFIAKAAILMDLSPHHVKLGQTFKIILTQEGSSQFDTPDLSALQMDFTVMGTERSASYSMINGQTSSSNRWIIVLQPQKTGRLIIPSISLGKEKTAVSSIEVSASQGANGARENQDEERTEDKNVNTKDVFLTASVNNKNPYVNEQVNYTVKLYRNQNLLDASYQAPKVENALLVPLGNSLRYQDLKNGQMYTVEEQHYAIFPQKSGELTILGPILNTLLYNGLMPEQIKINAPKVSLNVQPAVVSGAKFAEWTPAKKLLLYESYDKNENTFSEGSTLQRRITLEGIGLPAQLLPKIAIEKGKDFSVYEEKGVEKNQLKNNELIGKKSTKLTYLLNKPGTIQIPEQKLRWFNSQTKQEETVSLPPRTLNIQAIPASAERRLGLDLKSPTASPMLSTAPEKSTETPWWWIAAVFAFLWVMTLLLWWKGSALFGKNKEKKQKLKQQLKQACLNNDAALARTLLIGWGTTTWPEAQVLDLADITRFSKDEALNKEINILIKSLYQSKSKSWQGGAALWQCISAFRKSPEKQKTKNGHLPPANPR